MKIYVVAVDDIEGYGRPEHAFVSRELAEEFAARELATFEIFELDVLDSLASIPVSEQKPAPQNHPPLTNPQFYMNEILRRFMDDRAIGDGTKTATSVMLKARAGIETRRNVIEAEFDCYTNDHPSRCALCSTLKPAGTRMAWVDSSSVYHRNDSYEELLLGSRQSKSRTGSCFACIAASRATEMIR